MREIIGDITEITNGIIMHQVNCQNVMGSGVARALYEKYPQVKSDYHKFCEGQKPKKLLGCVQTVFIDRNLIVVNSFTQLNFGKGNITGVKYTDEKLLINSIKELDSFAKARSQTAYVPKYIGCCQAGGDWAAIESALKETDIVVVGLPQ